MKQNEVYYNNIPAFFLRYRMMSGGNSTACIGVCECARECMFMNCNDIYNAALRYYGTAMRATEEVFRCTGCSSETACTKAEYFDGYCHATIMVGENQSATLQKCTDSGDRSVLMAMLLFLISCMLVGAVWFVRQQRSAYSVAPAGIVPTPVSYADDAREGKEGDTEPAEDTKDTKATEHASV